MEELRINFADDTGKLAKGRAEAEKLAQQVFAQIEGGEAAYKDVLGWLDVAQWAGEARCGELAEMARQIREKCEVFVLVGVGGSNQAARAVIEALRIPGGPEILYMGNTLSACELKRAMEALKGRRFCINVIAKNFETLEPGLSFRLLRQELQARHGDEAGAYIYTTVTKGSRFEEISRQNGYTVLFFPDDIGGRYSVFSDVGLLPMAVAGVDIRRLVQGGEDMRRRLYAEGAKSPALQYAAARQTLNRQGYQIEMQSFFEPRLRYFCKWWVQLFGESEGKEDKGIFPAGGEFSEDLHAVGQFVQQGAPILFENFLRVAGKDAALPMPGDTIGDGFAYLDGMDVWDVNTIAQNATIGAHSARLPCVVFDIPCISEYWLGQLFYLFMFACYASGKMMGINPFDQDGVEAYKERMFKSLGK